MRGLILKDFYSIGRSGKVLLPMILFFFVMSFAAGSTSFATGYVMVLALLLPITSMSYDAASKWDTYAVSLPISRTKIVLSKYLFLLILMLLAILLVTVYSVVMWAIGMVEGVIGQAVVKVVDIPKLFDISLALLKENPLLFICHNPNCNSCHWSRLLFDGKPIDMARYDKNHCSDDTCEICVI